MAIKAIFFDAGRILFNFDEMRSCRLLSNFSPHHPEDVYRAIYTEGLMRQFDSGLDVHEFYARVRIAIRAESLSFDRFLDIWSDFVAPSESIEDVLASIRRDVDCLIVSNTDMIRWPQIAELSVVARFFSNPRQWILSFQVGATKPDARIFREGIRRANSAPEEILFIDDIPAYVEAFQSLGGLGFVHDCRIHDLDHLKEGLADHGLIRT